MTANDWILPWFMLMRIMYIMLNWIWVMRSDFPVVVITSGFQNIKPLLFHNWPVHTGYRLAGMQVCRCHIFSALKSQAGKPRANEHPSIHQHFRQLAGMSPLRYQKWLRLNEAGDWCWMNITMSPLQPMLSVTKAYPISVGNFGPYGEVLILDGATFSAKTDLIDGTNILPFGLVILLSGSQ